MVNRNVISDILNCSISSVHRDVCISMDNLVTMPKLENGEVFRNSGFLNRGEIQPLLYEKYLKLFKRQWCAYKVSSKNFVKMARNSSPVCTYVPSCEDQKEYICSAYGICKGFEDRMEDCFKFSGGNTSLCCIPGSDPDYLEHLEACVDKVFDCIEKNRWIQNKKFCF